MSMQRRKTAHQCPDCNSPVVAHVVLVETMQTTTPIEKHQGFSCSGHCGWETLDVRFFDSTKA